VSPWGLPKVSIRDVVGPVFDRITQAQLPTSASGKKLSRNEAADVTKQVDAAVARGLRDLSPGPQYQDMLSVLGSGLLHALRTDDFESKADARALLSLGESLAD
jgi:hypothetical protein